MYKKLIKVMEQNLVKKLEMYNYKYLKKEKQFIGLYNEFVFRISFDEAGYGSRVEIHLEYDYPLVRNNLNLFPKHYMRYGSVGENENWNIEKTKIKDLDNLKHYMSDMQFIFENYFYLLTSKVINAFNIEQYIQHEYDELFDNYLEEIGEEDPAWEYQMEFLASGKSQEEWTSEDDKKCEQLTKEKQEKEFPYEKVKQEILHNIEKNRPIYEKEIVKHFGNNYPDIIVDKEVLPVTLEKVMLNGELKEKILEAGFNEYLDKNLQGVQIYGESLFFKKDDIELRVNLQDELFLDFIVTGNGKSERVNVYDGNYFWFGWLVGKEAVFEENINKAYERLIEVVKKVYRKENT